MKVILLQELKGRGGEGDVVEVKRGYAVNYLFPQKFAIEATKGNLKQLELRKHNIAKRESERLDSADKIQGALADKVITIAARVGEEGQLFGSVTTQQIAEKLKEELGLVVDRRKIDVHTLIKTAGEHSVTVSVYRDTKATLTIRVVDENDEAKEAVAADAATAKELDDAANQSGEADAAAEELKETESADDATPAAEDDAAPAVEEEATPAAAEDALGADEQ